MKFSTGSVVLAGLFVTSSTLAAPTPAQYARSPDPNDFESASPSVNSPLLGHGHSANGMAGHRNLPGPMNKRIWRVDKRQTPFDAAQSVVGEATPLLAQASVGQGATPLGLVGSTAGSIVPINLASVPGTVSAQNLQGALTDLPGTVGSIANGLPGTLQGISNTLPAPVNGIVGGLLGTVGGVAGPLLGAVEGPVAPVLGTVGGILGPTVGGTVGGLLGQVGGTLQGVTAPVDSLAPGLGLGGLLGGLTGSLNGILAAQPVSQASVPGQAFLAQPQVFGSAPGSGVPMSTLSNSPPSYVANVGQGRVLAASSQDDDIENIANIIDKGVSNGDQTGSQKGVQNQAGKADFAIPNPSQGTPGQVMQVPQSAQSIPAPMQQAQTAPAAAIQYVKVNDNLVPVQLDAAGRVLGLAAGLPTITAASLPGHSIPDLSSLQGQLPSQAVQGLASAQSVAQPVQQQISSAMGKLPVRPSAAQTLLPSQMNLADVDPTSSDIVSALDTAEDGVDTTYDPSSDDTADALSLVAGAVNGASGTPYTAASAMASTPVSAASAAASSAYGAPQWDDDDWVQPDQSLLGHYASTAGSMGFSATAAAENAIMTGTGASAIVSAPTVSATAINGAQ